MAYMYPWSFQMPTEEPTLLPGSGHEGRVRDVHMQLREASEVS